MEMTDTQIILMVKNMAREMVAVSAKNGQYSEEFKKKVDANGKKGNFDNQVSAAETLGSRFAVNPEAVWRWANKYSVNLTLSGHKIIKAGRAFADAVVSGKPLEGI